MLGCIGLSYVKRRWLARNHLSSKLRVFLKRWIYDSKYAIFDEGRRLSSC